MKLELLTPQKTVYSGKVVSARFPGVSGSFGVLNNHAPLVSLLKQGEIRIVEEKKKELTFKIRSGVVEVLNNRIVVLAE